MDREERYSWNPLKFTNNPRSGATSGALLGLSAYLALSLNCEEIRSSTTTENVLYGVATVAVSAVAVSALGYFNQRVIRSIYQEIQRTGEKLFRN